MSPVAAGVLGALALALGLATWKAPRLTAILVWSLIATIFFSAAILVSAPGAFKDKALWMTLAVPLIWTVFQFLAYWLNKPWRAVFGMMAVSVAGAAVVFLSEPMV